MQYTNLIWRDGQPYSEMFDDIYYSTIDGEDISGEAEFQHVFFKNNGLPERWQNGNDFVIAELGLGSALNCLLTIREWLDYTAGSDGSRCDKSRRLHYIAIERYPLSPKSIKQLLLRYPDLQPYCDEFLIHYPPAMAGSHTRFLFDNRVVIHFKFLDVYDALKDENLRVDAWYLDGFSPTKNSDMWSEKLFMKIAQNSVEGTTCSTYTAAGHVKRSLKSSGFCVRKVKGHGKKREMLVAEYTELKNEGMKYSDEPWFTRVEKTAVSDTNGEKKLTIIGSGIAGLCSAYALVKRGWSVTIIDSNVDSASSNPAAIVYPRIAVNNDVDTEFYISAFFYALYCLKNIQTKNEEKFWFDEGLMQLFEKERIQAIFEKFQFNENYISIVNDIQKHNDELKLYGDDPRSVFVNYKTGGVVLPELLCKALKQSCGEKLNIISADISEIKHEAGQWSCYSESNLINQANVLIVANGTSVNKLLDESIFSIESVRGQVAILKDNKVSKNMKETINVDVYLTPSINGKHYAGATYTRGSENRLVDETDSRKLIESVGRCYSGVFKQDDYYDAWVGFRSMSMDRVPIVGAVPDKKLFEQEYADICHGNNNKHYRSPGYKENLFVTAAHGSRGFTTSFLSAELLASLIEGEPLPVSKRVFKYLSPSRFIVNNLKRR